MKCLRYVSGFCLTLGLCLMMLACLYTRHDIHITLDIRHIQETATNVEDVVSGKKDMEELKEKTSGALMTPASSRGMLACLFDLSTPAYAQSDGSAIKELTPALKEAIQSRKDRFDEVRKYKSSGAIGENNMALLETRAGDSLNKNKAIVENVISDENRDRMTIYREIAKQNSADLGKVQKAWAEIQRKNAEAGDWIQAPSDLVFFENFLRSRIAQKLPNKPSPGEWVKAP